MISPSKPAVLTFGETMLRFSPPRHQRLIQAEAFDVWVAGSESNVAAALSALGRSATWVSRLPDNPLGRKIEIALRGRGVAVSQIVWTPSTERVGLFYAEPAVEPRSASVVYDRAGSAASFLSSADLPDALFESHTHLHLSGITSALSPLCAETVAAAIFRAKARGLTVSFDVNYRAKLWTPEAAAAALAPLIPQTDILFCSRDDALRLFGLSGTAAERAVDLQAIFGVPVVAVTAGSDGAACCDDAGACYALAVPVTTSVERFGSGDAFAAGFLSEYLAGAFAEEALRFAVAVAALKRTIPGDMLVATRAEVEALLAQEEATGWR